VRSPEKRVIARTSLVEKRKKWINFLVFGSPAYGVAIVSEYKGGAIGLREDLFSRRLPGENDVFL